MNTLAEVAVDKEGNQVELNKWIEDEHTGAKTMYTRVRSIPFCSSHTFDRNMECTKCPYVFRGFRAHLHIRKADGIYDRKTDKKIA